MAQMTLIHGYHLVTIFMSVFNYVRCCSGLFTLVLDTVSDQKLVDNENNTNNVPFTAVYC